MLLAFEFHDFDTGIPRQIRGRLKALFHAPSHQFVRMSFNDHDAVKEIQWPRADGVIRYVYEYASESGLPQRLGCVTLFHGSTPVRRVSYQYLTSHQAPMGLRLLKGTNTERWHGSHWLPEQRVVFRYARNQAQLREVKVWEAPPASSFLVASMTRYEVRYNPLGKVVWIRHEGHGPSPQFFE